MPGRPGEPVSPLGNKARSVISLGFSAGLHWLRAIKERAELRHHHGIGSCHLGDDLDQALSNAGIGSACLRRSALISASSRGAWSKRLIPEAESLGCLNGAVTHSTLTHRKKFLCAPTFARGFGVSGQENGAQR